MDLEAVRAILSVGGAAWTATAIFALVVIRCWSSLPHLLDKWIAFRTAKAAERAADWTRLRDSLAEEREQRRLDRVEHDIFRKEQLAENEKCRRELADVIARLSRIEGFTIGRGEARQEAAVIESRQRNTEDDQR